MQILITQKKRAFLLALFLFFRFKTNRDQRLVTKIRSNLSDRLIPEWDKMRIIVSWTRSKLDCTNHTVQSLLRVAESKPIKMQQVASKHLRVASFDHQLPTRVYYFNDRTRIVSMILYKLLRNFRPVYGSHNWSVGNADNAPLHICSRMIESHIIIVRSTHGEFNCVAVARSLQRLQSAI